MCPYIREAICEKKIINIEFKLTSFVDIEKSKIKSTTLRGPPPIPKNADTKPSISPTNASTIFESILYVLKFFPFIRYIIIKNISKENTADCAPTIPEP